MTPRIVSRIAAAALLAACAPAAPQGPLLPLVSAEVEPGAAAGTTGETRFDVTATRGGASVAADCVAEGAGFAAAFRAPATLAVPVFGQASRPVRVACAAGDQRAARVIVPAFRSGGGYGGVYPSIGIGVGTGDWSGVSIGGVWSPPVGAGQVYQVRYPDLVLPLE